MALSHASSGVPLCIDPSASALSEVQSTAIFKSETLEVMRLVFAKGKTMPAHKVTGEITIQCLAGCVELVADGLASTLPQCHMVYLRGGVVHSLTATEDSCVLVHVVLDRSSGSL